MLCELVSVLREAYRLEDLVRRALDDYRRGSGDFADYVIGRSSEEAGCSTTATFDRGLKQAPGFRWLG